MTQSVERISWSDRDVGQKFSIIMAVALLAGSAFFFAYEAIGAALVGDWAKSARAAGVLLPLACIILGWKRHNARR